MPTTFPIADLHNDLLCYLAGDSKRTACDLEVRCSIPQLRSGNVKLQVLPMFSETEKGSSIKGWKQAELYRSLPHDYSESISHFHRMENLLEAVNSERIVTMLSIENASCFAEEEEPLQSVLDRLERIIDSIAKPFYISFTWNQENRFGGGAHTTAGLKADGISLMRFLHGKGIAIDLSHTSDALAYDILNMAEKESLAVPIIASHSNCRSVTDVARNLPDELIKAIVSRNGVIGINFVRSFVGKSDINLIVKHLEHFLSLGAEQNLSFGADFYYGLDVSPEHRKPSEEMFFPGYDDASAYPKVIELWQKHLNLSKEVIRNIAFDNLQRFILSTLR